MKNADTYKEAILKKYEEGKNLYLKELSPAKIRQDCVLKFKNDLNRQDLNTFGYFFDFKEASSKHEKVKEIERVDIDKFRPFRKFLNRETGKTFDKNIELIAVLVDFEPRPFNNYINLNPIFNKRDIEIEEKKEDLPPKIHPIKNERIATELPSKPNSVDAKIQLGNLNPILSVKNIPIALSVLVGFCLLLAVPKFTRTAKKLMGKQNGRCMVWTGDVYKEASCVTFNSITPNELVSFEESKVLNFKKVNVTASYPFFNEENEVNLWYSKIRKNKVDFFTAPGRHPITGKTLKAITPYIIEKYVPIHDISDASLESLIK